MTRKTYITLSAVLHLLIALACLVLLQGPYVRVEPNPTWIFLAGLAINLIGAGVNIRAYSRN